MYGLQYFDFRKLRADVTNATQKLTFKYTLSGMSNAEYRIYALVIDEKSI